MTFRELWEDFVRALKAFMGLPVVTLSDGRRLREEFETQDARVSGKDGSEPH